jgi:hypothetical protein
MSIIFANLSTEELANRADNFLELHAAQKAALADAVQPEPGAFRDPVTGTVYRIKVSRQSGRPYAFVLGPNGFTYTAGAIYRVRESMRLTFEEACAISAQIGECVVCGKTLTDPNSVGAGIGPVCRKRVLGAPEKRKRVSTRTAA